MVGDFFAMVSALGYRTETGLVMTLCAVERSAVVCDDAEAEERRR
jgi:hypothetical protein